MYKQLLLAILTALCCMTTTYAQTLKITDVNSANQRMYDSTTKRDLGKNLILEIFDKTAKVTLPGEQPLIMQLLSDGVYHTLVEDRKTEKMTADLVINKILGVVTSAKYTITISEVVGQHRQASVTLTAKRF